MRLHIKCPNCGHPATSTRTRQPSTLVTEISYSCGNSACGAAFVLLGEVHRWLRLPTQIMTGLNVPLSLVVHRNRLRDALDRLRTADLPPAGEIIGGPDDEVPNATRGDSP
ncbi:Ogr/Delta-like zinc finger [Variovorax sp. YR266]|uniref:ogr/Delta-like zinc finger family protein n=1 Tax=Variovorax sp. YR266 TaxID=1884386 RepID=UPI00089D1037|nr:ogr/Delta-like zinc finger family protein [Variovorax sp. YR266]SDZ69511.1 Ogr/Delta-like zinc finger [Variovorax sp. YR266]